jgi:hypothetical protein
MSIGAASAERNVGDPCLSGRVPSICSVPDLDDAILEAQRCVAESLDLDGVTLFERSDDGDLLPTHAWWRPEDSSPSPGCRSGAIFPWMLEKLMAGEAVCLSSPDGLLDGPDRASLRRFDLKSIVVVPWRRRFRSWAL